MTSSKSSTCATVATCWTITTHASQGVGTDAGRVYRIRFWRNTANGGENAIYGTTHSPYPAYARRRVRLQDDASVAERGLGPGAAQCLRSEPAGRARNERRCRRLSVE